MKYSGMPAGMWLIFTGSFKKHLITTLDYDAKTASVVTKKAKLKYKEIIGSLPEFEKADRFKMNIVNCAMLAAHLTLSANTRLHPAVRIAIVDTRRNDFL